MEHHKIRAFPLFIDVGVLVVLVTLMVLVESCFPTYRQGVSCGDPSVRKTKLDETVPMLAFLPYSLAIIWVVFLIEIDRFDDEKENPDRYEPKQILDYKIFNRLSLCRVLVRLYKYIGHYTIGICLTVLSTSCVKHVTGELRPHFWSVCEPHISCTAVTDYFAEFNCTHPDLDRVFQSFPSGHTSLAFYMSVFCMMYVHARVLDRGECSNTAVLVMQILFFVLAFTVGASRVLDNEHHIKDVAGGALLGSFIAFLTIQSSNIFDKRDDPKPKVLELEQV